MIDTEALRKKVIELAIQGKLTEQLPEDGDAEALYVQIQEEKANLIKEGKLKKEKETLPINVNDVPYVLPNNWLWVRLGTIGASEDNAFADGPFGSNLKTEHYTSEKQVRIIQLSNIGSNGWKNDNEKYTTFEHLKTIQRSEVKKGDIVIAKMMPAGRAILVPDVSTAYVLSSDCVKFVPNTLLDANYLCYAINSNMFHEQVLVDVHGIGRERTSLTNLKRYIVPLPPLAEQKRIVEKVDKILALIQVIDDLQKQYENNVEVLKKKIIDAGMRGQLTEQFSEDGDAEDLYVRIQEEKARLIKEGKIKKEKSLPEIPEETIPFKIPSNWKWVCWGNIVNIVSARRVHQTDWREDGVPFYRAREIAALADYGEVSNDLFISEELYEAFSKSGVPQAGDLMVTGVGTLGKTYVVRDNERFYYKDASVLCFENYANLNPDFLRRVMESELMRSQIESNSGGTTVDTLTMVRMNQYLLPLPPFEEQRRIADIISLFFEIVE